MFPVAATYAVARALRERFDTIRRTGNTAAADVKQRTNGQIEVQLFGSERLAKAAENFPAVARGTIEAAMSVNFQWGTTIPEMSATLIPYAMGDLERIKRVPASEARKLLDAKLAQRGVHSVAWLYITRQTIVARAVMSRPQQARRSCVQGARGRHA